MTTIIPSKSSASCESIKLGIDAHDKYYWVSCQVDGATPQPVRNVTYEELLLFVLKQQELTRNVATCYEGCVRGPIALQNIPVTGQWWKGKAWAAIKVLAPACGGATTFAQPRGLQAAAQG